MYHSVTGNTEKMAQGVAEGANGVSGTSAALKKVGEVTGDELLACDALIVGSPVYYANMAGEIKAFFDNWLLKFRFAFADFKMRNKVGGAFVTGGAISNGKETTMQSIHAAMLINQMSVVSGGGAFGASATTGPDSPGVGLRCPCFQCRNHRLTPRQRQIAIVHRLLSGLSHLPSSTG